MYGLDSGIKAKTVSTTLEVDECKEVFFGFLIFLFFERGWCWKPAAANVLELLVPANKG